MARSVMESPWGTVLRLRWASPEEDETTTEASRWEAAAWRDFGCGDHPYRFRVADRCPRYQSRSVFLAATATATNTAGCCSPTPHRTVSDPSRSSARRTLRIESPTISRWPWWCFWRMVMMMPNRPRATGCSPPRPPHEPCYYHQSPTASEPIVPIRVGTPNGWRMLPWRVGPPSLWHQTRRWHPPHRARHRVGRRTRTVPRRLVVAVRRLPLFCRIVLLPKKTSLSY